MFFSSPSSDFTSQNWQGVGKKNSFIRLLSPFRFAPKRQGSRGGSAGQTRMLEGRAGEEDPERARGRKDGDAPRAGRKAGGVGESASGARLEQGQAKASGGSADPTLGLSGRGVFGGGATRKPGQCGDLGDPRLEIEIDGRDYQGKRRRRGRDKDGGGGGRGAPGRRRSGAGRGMCYYFGEVAVDRILHLNPPLPSSSLPSKSFAKALRKTRWAMFCNGNRWRRRNAAEKGWVGGDRKSAVGSGAQRNSLLA